MLKHIFKNIITFFKFKSNKKDKYLEYLKESTKQNWVSFIDNSYLCEEKNFYLEINGEKARCTRQANLLPYQTPAGPFCQWFEIDKNKIHKYIK